MLGLLSSFLAQSKARRQPPPDRLFVFHMEGCHVCASARPLLKSFQAAHPHVRILSYDITTLPEWRAKKWSPEVTPTLVHLRPDGTWEKYDGEAQVGGGRVIDMQEMKTWLARQFP